MSIDKKYNIVIVGAGIVGLATAYQISKQNPGFSIAILEKEDRIAPHQSSHNSGVIHSGIYYTPGSLRALNCRKGYKYLLEFCKKHDLPYDICGKVIVATDETEIPSLDQILQKGIANGLRGIRKMTSAETNEHEPHVKAAASIWVPQAGITDYSAVAQQINQLLQQNGHRTYLNHKVLHTQARPEEIIVETEQNVFSADLLINCAGLYSDQVAAQNSGKTDAQILPFRGEYYELKKDKEYLVNHLIYPVPNPNFPFLGVHFTRMIQGGIEAGPNAVLAFKREGYHRWAFNFKELSETLLYPGFQRIAKKYWKDGLTEMKRSYSKKHFVKALQKLIPEIGTDDVERGRAGVRAMACGRDGELLDDYLFVEKKGIINVLNAPSPAATSSLAIGETIANKAIAQFD